MNLTRRIDRLFGRVAIILAFPIAFPLGVLILFLNEEWSLAETCRQVWRDCVNAFHEV